MPLKSQRKIGNLDPTHKELIVSPKDSRAGWPSLIGWIPESYSVSYLSTTRYMVSTHSAYRLITDQGNGHPRDMSPKTEEEKEKLGEI